VWTDIVVYNTVERKMRSFFRAESGRSKLVENARQILANRQIAIRHWRQSRSSSALRNISFLEKDLRQRLAGLIRQAQDGYGTEEVSEIRALLEEAGYKLDETKPEPISTPRVMTEKNAVDDVLREKVLAYRSRKTLLHFNDAEPGYAGLFFFP